MPNPSGTRGPRSESKTLSFNAPSIAAISSSVISPNSGFSQPEKRAAARAILRYNIHIDDDARPIPPGGLDPRYRDLHGKGGATGVELDEIKAVTNETFRDALDAVSYAHYEISNLNS